MPDPFDEPDLCCPSCSSDAGTKLIDTEHNNGVHWSVRVCIACEEQIHRGHYAPSEEQIERRMAEIRKSWSENVRESRSVTRETSPIDYELNPIAMPRKRKSLG